MVSKRILVGLGIVVVALGGAGYLMAKKKEKEEEPQKPIVAPMGHAAIIYSSGDLEYFTSGDIARALPSDASITVTGRATAGSPKPDMNLTIEISSADNFLPGWIGIAERNFLGVNLNQEYSFTERLSPQGLQNLAIAWGAPTTVTGYGGVGARAKMTLNNIAGTTGSIFSLEAVFRLAPASVSPIGSVSAPSVV